MVCQCTSVKEWLNKVKMWGLWKESRDSAMNSEMVHASILGIVRTTKAENQVGKPNQLSLCTVLLWKRKIHLFTLLAMYAAVVDASILRDN